VSDDPIGDAIHAEAEEARSEIRAAGITCPSCGVNAADLPDGHKLEIGAMTAQCEGGRLVAIGEDGPDIFAAVVQVSLFDEYRAAIAEAGSALFGMAADTMNGK
jgi:hypothetical protein